VSSDSRKLDRLQAAGEQRLAQQRIDDCPRLGERLLLVGTVDVAGQDAPLEGLLQLLVCLGARFRDPGLLHLVEELDDLLVGLEAQGSQQHGRRLLALPVDVHVQDVVDVGGELDPRSPVGDDPRPEQAPAVGVDLVAEEHARRSVQLRDDDALGPVD
jgi:hypothetical protein